MTPFVFADEPSSSSVVVGMPNVGSPILGQMTFDPEAGISVETLHADPGLMALAFGKVADFPVLHGRLHGGEPFTLLDCAINRARFGGGGIAEVRISADRLLVGAHLSDVHESPFDELCVSLTSIDSWFGDSPIEIEWAPQRVPDDEFQVRISCRRYGQFGFSPLKSGTSLMSNQSIEYSDDRPVGASLQSERALRLMPRRHFGVESCDDELNRLQAFLTLLFGHQAFYRKVVFLRHDVDAKDRHRQTIRYLPRFAQPNDRRRAHRQEILFPLPTIRDQLPSLWTTWTDRYDELRSPLQLYMSTQLFGGQLLDFQFLTIAQALETLHRTRFGGVFVAGDVYDRVRNAVLSAVPAGTDPDLRSALKSRLEYGNELSLRQRLKRLARTVPESIASAIHPDLAKFLNRVVDTRNFFTHHDRELEAKSYTGADLYWAMRLLRWFFLCVVLIDIGLSEATLIERVSASEELRHARESMHNSG